MILAYYPGYVKTDQTPEPLSAPQANMMRSTLETFLGKEGVAPWTLYGTGAVIAVILTFLGISPLAFSLGMYLPMEINSPLVLGGLIVHLLSKGSKDEAVNKRELTRAYSSPRDLLRARRLSRSAATAW